MKNVFLFFVAMFVMISATVAQTSVWDGTHTTWTNGTGTESNPYLIENAQQLAYLAYYVNNGTDAVENVVGSGKFWKLTTNIDLNSLSWEPIGFLNDYTDYYFFGGHFDGNGHTVANLVTSEKQRAGFFGMMKDGSVKNVGIIGNSSIFSDYSGIAGGIVGHVTGSFTINNCYNTGTISSYLFSGGIIGNIGIGNVTIDNCYNTGNVSATDNAGGIVGRIATSDITINVTIDNCYNTGDVSSATKWVGGIVGGIDTDNITITINNCYNTGKLNSNYAAGGIVGLGDNLIISNCYNTGSVFSSSRSGGIVGTGTETSITDCNNTGSVSSSGFSGGMIGCSYGSLTVNNCYNTGSVSSSYSPYSPPAGGILGFSYTGTITISNCYNTGSVSSAAASGGIVGGIDSSSLTINNCYNTGSVSSSFASGGIVGSGGILTINNCDNTGNVSSSGVSGGIVGGGSPTISNCYNTGDVSSSDYYSGGIVGHNYGSNVINNCYNTGSANYGIVGDNTTDVSYCYYLNTSAPNSGGGIPRTEAFMKTQEFVDLLNNGPVPNSAYTLDINVINEGYPIFKWQQTDATLSNLTVSEGKLSPAFNSDIYDYTVDVAYSIEKITITATASVTDATVVGTGEKQLAIGINFFTITVTATDGVTKSDYIVTVNRADDVGIVGTDNYMALRIFPNPTDGELQIINYELEIVNVEVFDVRGKLVWSLQSTAQPTTTINISHLPTDIYFIRIQTENGVITRKIIKH